MVRLKKIATGTTGSEIAEAALVLPIFFLIMLGIYWFGRAFNTYATINHAAREGARVGVAQTCATCGNPNSPTTNTIATQVKQSLQASSLDPTQVQNLGGTANRTACGGGNTRCQVPSGPGTPDLRLLQCATPQYFALRLRRACLRNFGSVPISLSIRPSVHFSEHAENHAERRRADDGRILGPCSARTRAYCCHPERSEGPRFFPSAEISKHSPLGGAALSALRSTLSNQRRL